MSTEEENGQNAETPEESPLDINVGVENGRVFIQFSQMLSIVAMPPDSAETMALALQEHAKEARKTLQE